LEEVHWTCGYSDICRHSQRLHHGTLRTKERSALFFVYTAAIPKRPEECEQYSDLTYQRPDRLVAEPIVNICKPTV
jgi:hypothetical protein